MFDRNNFMGMNGFIWWVGVIEDRVDPLAIGRCRVRIIGWHSDNKSLVPTDSLPWAVPIFPINDSQKWSAPPLNSWIMGFFMDGENGQVPYMLGVIPYVK